MPDPPDPLDPHDPPPRDRYCDLVLKGGVVDGVIYPGVLLELARGFRFQSLAGTSVGAIAAALAAASEYARRFGSDNGFNEVLRTLPGELGKPAPGRPGVTTLESLFQTDPWLRKLFQLLVEALSVRRGQLRGKLLASVGDIYVDELSLGAVCCLVFWALHLAGMAGSAAPGPYAVLQFVTLGLYGLSILFVPLLFSLVVDVLRLAAQPGRGFCSGLSTDGGKTDGLTEWLHRGIQGAAGLPLRRPLTFKDLWTAPGGPNGPVWHADNRSIDLRMVTTCVSHGRPYEMPLRDDSVRLFFRPSELEHYFPEAIIQHLLEHSTPYQLKDMEFSPARIVDGRQAASVVNSPYPEEAPRDKGRCALRELPKGDLPVLVAVRLSMCFPVLFQAVPLWAIDHERGRTRFGPFGMAPEFKRAWFVDGGITSNFPLHIFDNPFPKWPTFGVYIKESYRKRDSNDDGKRDAMPRKSSHDVTTFHTSGRSEKWYELESEEPRAASEAGRARGFGTFLWGLVFAGKDWADNANMRMPGIRDRVAVVFKNDPTRGGLNLKLDSQSIRDLAYRTGTAAGQELARKFLQKPARGGASPRDSAGWRDHRWVRFNAYVAALKAHVRGFSDAVGPAHGAPSLREQIREATVSPPLYYRDLMEHTLSTEQADALLRTVDAIEALEQTLAQDEVVQPYQAKPQVELKARSPL